MPRQTLGRLVSPQRTVEISEGTVVEGQARTKV